MQPITTNSVSGPVVVLLKFLDLDTPLYWLIHCNDLSLNLFKNEISLYNTYIDLLSVGEAAPHSYVDAETADNLVLAKNKDYQKFFERPSSRWLYEPWNYNFTIINLYSKDVDEDLDDEDEVRELQTKLENKQLTLNSKLDLFNIITKPYNSLSEFGMGYRVLPITKALFI